MTVTRQRGRPTADAAPGQQGRYGLLLILLIVTYLLSAFVRSNWISVAQLALFVATGGLALRSSRLSRRQSRVLLAVSAAGSAAAAGLALARPSDGAVAAASLWTGLLLLATVALIVVRIVSYPTVTEESIFGAVSAYLLIGLMFAAFYAAISKGHGGHFFADGQPGNSQTFQYFSFTTLTTLGYGDFTAAGSDGRALAVMEALTGQVFLATLVARLVAAFRVSGGRRAGGQPGAPGGVDGSGGPAGGWAGPASGAGGGGGAGAGGASRSAGAGRGRGGAASGRGAGPGAAGGAAEVAAGPWAGRRAGGAERRQLGLAPGRAGGPGAGRLGGGDGRMVGRD